MAVSVCKALSYLHNDKRLLHGDIKSANILIKADFDEVYRVSGAMLSECLTSSCVLFSPDLVISIHFPSFFNETGCLFPNSCSNPLIRNILCQVLKTRHRDNNVITM